jgi:hypothetical protein
MHTFAEETNLAVELAGGAKACEHASTAAADTAISLEAATILKGFLCWWLKLSSNCSSTS